MTSGGTGIGEDAIREPSQARRLAAAPLAKGSKTATSRAITMRRVDMRVRKFGQVVPLGQATNKKAREGGQK